MQPGEAFQHGLLCEKSVPDAYAKLAIAQGCAVPVEGKLLDEQPVEEIARASSWGADAAREILAQFERVTKGALVAIEDFTATQQWRSQSVPVYSIYSNVFVYSNVIRRCRQSNGG
ncbi:hypothetical protein [Aromatoleum buckelii]|uniref:Uncharacterized protein n=1 Tax=Aromatoleum buckelii TaxID=200254 RepID=A0ABX1N3K4_9RHOO|nr:hypothetical protein [Aromatoleum buckelii]MCK0511774.1 hypothetical protein [Aromatoleum buckelii]